MTDKPVATQQDATSIANLADKSQQVTRAHERLDGQMSILGKRVDTVESLSDEQGDHFVKLVLQLRYDQIDTFKALIKLNRSYCLALGISPLNSHSRNLERSYYALGSDSLQHELHHILSLIDKLNDVSDLIKVKSEHDKKRRKRLEKLARELKKSIHDYEREVKVFSAEDTPSKQKKKIATKGLIKGDFAQLIHELHSVAELQAQFQFSINQLTEAFQRLSAIPKFGLVYNYIASLEGPISRFYLAEQNGVKTIASIVKNINSIIKNSLPAEIETKDDTLEQQAKLARSTNFFHH